MPRKIAISSSLLAFALVVFCASGAIAHDFWIQPSAYVAGKGEHVDIRLIVGHGDEREEKVRKPERIVRFELHGPGGMVAIAGPEGKTPAGAVDLADDGFYTVVYQSNHAFIELEPGKFDGYLREEGLERIIDDRKRRGESKKPGKEVYARYLKALVCVGKATTGFDRKIGLPLELTALNNPFALGPKDRLTAVLEFAGKPLANARVELISIADLGKKLVAKSDEQGRVEFALPDRGKWMLAATHMRRAEPGAKGDWESFWTTLTFESRGR